jgi:hypothetical protein
MLSKPSASHTRRGFALTLLTHARNPIKFARALYPAHDSTVHALLSGSEAEHLGERLGEELVDTKYTSRQNLDGRNIVGGWAGLNINPDIFSKMAVKRIRLITCPRAQLVPWHWMKEGV